MSAVSVPKPAEHAEPTSDAEGWALLEAMRRRLDEQVALGRKTQAQVTQLADSIAGLVTQQRRRSLWLNVNSFVAYVVFTILCGAGCFLLYRSRASELSAARDQAVVERDAAVRRADEATQRAVAREAAGNQAWEVYELLEAGKRGDAVARLEALRDQPLSRTERAVLAARARETQLAAVDAAVKSAVASLKAGRPGDAIRPLEAALAGDAQGPRAATIHYYLGAAYARTDLEKSVAHFQAAVAADVDQDDAHFQLASALDRSGAYAQARGEYDRFVAAHPQSTYALFAMRRSAMLRGAPAAAPSAPQGAAPAGSGVVPAGSAAPAAPASTAPATTDPSAAAPSGTISGGARMPVRAWTKPLAKPAPADGSATERDH